MSNLDDILESALNECHEENNAGPLSVADATSKALAASAAIKDVVAGNVDTSSSGVQQHMETLVSQVNDPGFQAALDEALRQMGGGSHDGVISDKNMANELFQSLASESGAEGAQGIAQTMELLQNMSLDMEKMGGMGAPGSASGALESMSDEMIQKMMSEFEAMGQKQDFNAVVDNMMKMLLNKDIMYVPMKQICERFPAWLAKHGSSQSKEEYENYGKMYQIFQKLVNLYESQPDNFPLLMELMQDLQECGQPPAEIIHELAPGLELSSDNLPMLPNMGPGMEIPGGAGVNCSIM